jgi:protein-disulfide isomerase
MLLFLALRWSAWQVHAQGIADGGASGSAGFTAAQAAEVERIVRQLLLSKPEILLEAQRALEARQERERNERTEKAIADNAKAIFGRSDAPFLGNPRGDVTIVAFFDYNCPYCRRASDALRDVMAKDSHVRIVIEELPILSKGSEEAARIALAAGLQGKYERAHAAIGAVRGPITGDAALKAVAGLGLDMERLKRDTTSEAVANELTLVRRLAEQLVVEGTPFFIVGDTVIPGAPENLAGALRSAIAAVRSKGCRHCKS